MTRYQLEILRRAENRELCKRPSSRGIVWAWWHDPNGERPQASTIRVLQAAGFLTVNGLITQAGKKKLAEV